MLKNWMGHFFYIGRASGQVWPLSALSLSITLVCLGENLKSHFTEGGGVGGGGGDVGGVPHPRPIHGGGGGGVHPKHGQIERKTVRRHNKHFITYIDFIKLTCPWLELQYLLQANISTVFFSVIMIHMQLIKLDCTRPDIKLLYDTYIQKQNFVDI